MLMGKKKVNVLKRKAMHEECAAEENLQSLGSWIQKIEQTMASVSSRLSAVEKRLSGAAAEQNIRNPIGMQGPVETLLLHVKNKKTGQVARLLDGELSLVHNELVHQQQETDCLKKQIQDIKETNARNAIDVQTMQTSISKINIAMEQHTKHAERPEPFMMHVGAVEIPIEFTGVIGGLLAFTVAILVLINQKAVLLSPVFLFSVGALFLGCAVVKILRSRTRTMKNPSFSMPFNPPAAQINAVASKQKEG